MTQGRPSTGFNDFVTSYKILSRNSSTNLEIINSRQNEGVSNKNIILHISLTMGLLYFHRSKTGLFST